MIERMQDSKLRSIAFYLPQFHPIPENDIWWGKGFTEWTNVGKAKPLFRGHYQPHVPADLGYYDLRMQKIRTEQAKMAELYGLDGFCYWHYWFGNGSRLLESPFNEVLKSGEPDFPFCLGWANHSWEAKNWSTNKQKNKILKKQDYPGMEDCIAHFEHIKTAFHDKRYIKINGKPVFVIWEPLALPNDFDYIKKWRDLAQQSGLTGVYFIGFTFFKDRINEIYERGYDHVLYDGLFDARNSDVKLMLFIKKVIREILGYPIRLKYSKYQRTNLQVLLSERVLPCIMPNYDHTPRSGKRGLVLESTPKLFERLLTKVVLNIEDKKLYAPFIFIKSWNEWGEGNHLEPDLKYGHKFLEALRNGLGLRNK